MGSCRRRRIVEHGEAVDGRAARLLQIGKESQRLEIGGAGRVDQLTGEALGLVETWLDDDHLPAELGEGRRRRGARHAFPGDDHVNRARGVHRRFNRCRE